VAEAPKFFTILALAPRVVLAGSFARGLTRSEDAGATWKPVADGPASVNALASTNDGRVLAGTGAGVAVSHDRGVSWRGAGLEGMTVYAVLATAATVLAGTTQGLFRLTDGAWRPVPGLEGTVVYRLVVAAGGAVVVATDGVGVWRIDGDGAARPDGLAGHTVHALALDEAGRVVAGTNGRGVHVQHTERQWQPMSAGLPDTVVHVLVSGRDAAVFAGTGAGVARFDGDRWLPLHDGLPDRRIFSLAVDGDGRVFAGSYDGVWTLGADGLRWTRVDTGLAAASAYSVAIGRSGLTYAGTASGVRCSGNLGETWTAADAGLEGLTAYAFLEREAGDVLAATDDGVFRRQGDGPWERCGLEGEWVFTLTAAGGSLLAGTRGHGLRRSTDDGRTWRPANDGLDYFLVNDVLATSWGELFLAAGEVIAGRKTGGLFRSSDAGCTWMAAETEPVAVYRVVETHDGSLVAGAQRCRVLVSGDRGDSWRPLDTTGMVDTKVFALAASGEALVLGTAGGLLRSFDGAQTWEPIGRGLPEPTAFDLAVAPAGELLAATPAGVWRSLDGGTSWSC
jgi:hypothetical protein